MRNPVLATASLSSILPLLLAASGAPIPEGIPWWAALLASAAAPCATYLGHLVVKAVAARFRASGEEKLSDADPSNDASGRADLATASALDPTAAPPVDRNHPERK